MPWALRKNATGVPSTTTTCRRYTNRNHTTLSEVLAGEKPGRENDAQTTLHHNFSAAIQFAAVGYLVYRYAKDNGLGHELPLEWFQQDIRN